MAGSSGLLIAGKLLAVIVLVFANGFFVAAEFALVAVRRSRVEQLVVEGRARARVLQRAVNHLDAYLAATQLGVTMSSLGLGWLGEPAIAALLEPALDHLLPGNLALLGAHTLGVLIAFTIITALHIVLGELAPKSLALQRPEETALFVIQLLELYLRLFRPAVYALNSLGNWVLTLLGLETGNSEELIHSPAELQLLVSATREAGLLEEAQEEVVERVFRLGEQRVSALMTPRLDIVWLDLEDSIGTLQQQVIESVHSNFLVCQESVDHPIGFLRAKEFLATSLTQPPTPTELKALLTPLLYIPESIRAFNALELFKTSGSHIAVVVDEYGATQGLVTLNDLLEAIVGDIHTGNEPFEPQAIRREDGSWLVDGMLSIDEFKERFHFRQLPLGEGVDYQTIGGFILYQLGHIPTVSESFTWNHFDFEVVAMDGYRIDQVVIIPHEIDAKTPPVDS
ncbi:MAG: hemolysin family protein [Leptolyngbya sp. BL-A-14]